jgi:hypothetical protein
MFLLAGARTTEIGNCLSIMNILRKWLNPFIITVFTDFVYHVIMHVFPVDTYNTIISWRPLSFGCTEKLEESTIADITLRGFVVQFADICM